MTKDEFINICTQGGYCRKSTAITYTEGKDSLSERDFEEVFRIEQEKQSKIEANKERFRDYQGIKCTKRLRGGTRAENKFMFNHE